MGNLNKQMLIGGTWMIGAKWAVRGIGIISTLILVRLISPEGFGLIAMATVFFGLLNILGTFALDSALIYRKKPDVELYHSAWTFNALIGLVEALLLIALARPIAHYYDEPRLELIIYVLSIGFVLNGIKNIGTVDFRKNLEFHKEFFYSSSQKIISFFVTIPLAFLLKSYWALIIGLIIGRAGECLVGYIMHSYRPKISLKGWRELINFSMWIYVGNLVNFFARRGPELILGKVAGISELGIYNIGREVATIPTLEMISPINRALFPAFSTISDKLHKLRKSYNDVSSMIAMAVVPAGVGIAAVSETLVPVALGQSWMGAIPVIKLIGIAGAIRSLYAGSSSVFYALGKPKLQTLVATAWMIFLFPIAYYMGRAEGGVGVAKAILIAELLITPVNIAMLVKALDMSILVWLSSIYRTVLASATMYGLLYWYSSSMVLSEARSFNSLVMELLLQVLFGAGVYAISIMVLWFMAGRPEGAEERLINIVNKIYKKYK